MRTACLRSLLRAITRNGVFVVALVLLSAYFAPPSIIPSETGTFRFGAEFQKANRHEGLAEAVESGVYDTAPQNGKIANERQLALLEITQGDDIAASLRVQDNAIRHRIVIVGIFSFAIALRPAALISAVVNGVGEPGYPVVLIQSGSVVTLTVLSAFARTCALLFASTLLVIAISSASFAISASSVAGWLFSLTLGFVPAVPQFFRNLHVV